MAKIGASVNIINKINSLVFGGKKVLQPNAKTPQGYVVICEGKEETHIYTGHNVATVSAISIGYDRSHYWSNRVCRTDAQNNKIEASCEDQTGEVKHLSKGAYDKLFQLAKTNKTHMIWMRDDSKNGCRLSALPEKLIAPNLR